MWKKNKPSKKRVPFYKNDELNFDMFNRVQGDVGGAGYEANKEMCLYDYEDLKNVIEGKNR